MFLLIAIQNNKTRCLQFLWWEDPEQIMEIYEIQASFWGKKLADLSKLRFAAYDEGQCFQQRNSRQNTSPS